MTREKAHSFSHLEAISKRVVMRVRHRPGYALTIGLVVTFILASLQYSDVLQPSASYRSESYALTECIPRSAATSLWPWRALRKQNRDRDIDIDSEDSVLRDQPIGQDPSEKYPLFRELQRAPDPLYAEFVSWHGDDYIPPPKPKYRHGHSPKERKKQLDKIAKALEKASKSKGDDKKDGKDKDNKRKAIKDSDDDDTVKPIPDPFPLLSQLDKASVQAYLPKQHNTKTRTPLLIGFTRNWPLLLQCVTSYMAAGWPARDIYVIENTGTMGANRADRLSLQNPFFLNHTQLVDTLGVNVIETPTLFTFAQLQNFYLYTAQQMNWPQYFWSHQDVVVFSEEGYVEGSEHGFFGSHGSFVDAPRSFHHRALATLKILTHRAAGSGGAPTWATHFFDYDRLTLVNVQAYLAVGAWDTHISFYGGDCDMYLRLKWAGYWQGMLLPPVGRIFDVAGVLDNLGALFYMPGVAATVGGWGAKGAGERAAQRNKQQLKRSTSSAEDEAADLVYVVEQMHRAKNDGNEAIADALEPIGLYDGNNTDDTNNGTVAANSIEVSERNAWQRRQQGGQGEPFYRDPEGFESGLQMHIAVGRQVYADKWGHRGCDLDVMGVRTEDAWHLEHDWDQEDGSGSDGGGW